MDSSIGQGDRPKRVGGRGPGSAATRERLMTAAAELVAELGWGRVTTRAVAARAELPHGAVSYHFRGKQELLVEASMHAFEKAMPFDQFAALPSVDDLIAMINAEIGDRDAIDPVLSRLMLETMREAERDQGLRERLGAVLHQYREVIVQTVRADQQRGTVTDSAPPDGLATLVAAAGDGLLLHALLDPDLDIAAAIEALRALLRTA